MQQKISLTTIAKALANNEFTFYYQPIVSLITGKICGAESLIRWIQPDGRVIPPSLFIPLAEETGFITEITQELIPRSVHDLISAQAVDRALWFSINVSAKDFLMANFASIVEAALANRISSPDKLRIEITESSFLPLDAITKKTLFDIADLGVPIMLDDFSAGHTTLSNLNRLPFTMIKLSMEIVQRSIETRDDFRLLRHLISMGHQLRLEMIAEGVETLEMHNLVVSSGCTDAQGYLYSCPLPLPEYLDLVQQQQKWMHYPFGSEYLAQIDHIDFRRDVMREVLVIHNEKNQSARDRAFARLPKLDHTECLLGEWYFNAGQQHKDDPTFIQLGIEHERFHEMAKLLLNKTSCDESWEQIEPLLNAFSAQSIQILQIMQELAKKDLIDYLKFTV